MYNANQLYLNAQKEIILHLITQIVDHDTDALINQNNKHATEGKIFHFHRSY